MSGGILGTILGTMGGSAFLWFVLGKLYPAGGYWAEVRPYGILIIFQIGIVLTLAGSISSSTLGHFIGRRFGKSWMGALSGGILGGVIVGMLFSWWVWSGER